MTWFAFKNDGNVYDLNGAAEKELAATFAHGYGTMAEAVANPNDPATPDQAALLATFVAAASSPVPGTGSAQGVIQVVNVNASGSQTGQISAANNPLVNAIAGGGNVFAGLAGETLGLMDQLQHWELWASIGWLVLGLILMGLGMLLLLREPVENVAGQVIRAAAIP
jgi:hypothetical protein